VSTSLSSGPDAATVMRRTLILRHQLTKAIATPPAEFLSQLMKEWSAADGVAFLERSKAMNERQIVYLRTSGLWPLMTPQEQEFAAVTFQDTTPQQHADALWSAEAAGVLMWALGLIPSMPQFDTRFDESQLRPFPQEDVHALVKGAALRPKADVARARDVAQLWHWRSRTAQLQNHVDEIVRVTAREAHKKGDIPTPVDGDFPAHAKAYRDLSDLERSQMMSIAMERHRALNWLCGFAPQNRWDETTTGT
jgi:hypothetical protein